MLSTDRFIPNLPTKEPCDVDFIQFLEDFNPSTLSEEGLKEFARRNPFVTAFEFVPPIEPVKRRMEYGEFSSKMDLEDLQIKYQKYCDAKISGQPSERLYKNARTALIKALGSKAALYLVRKEYEGISAEDRQKQEADYQTLMESYHTSSDDDVYYEYDYHEDFRPAKVIRVRKGVLASNGKPLTQREFAKYIGYPINKLAAAEKGDSEVEDALLEKLVMICQANPWWLFDDDCFADYANYTDNGDEPTVFVPCDVILKWINAGRPRKTSWREGMNWDR